jgi:uncharacterized protein (TIGR02611 family)
VDRFLDRIDGVAASIRGGSEPSRARRTTLLVLGWVVLVVGAALVPLPGPGLPVVALGLGLLAGHHAWARDALARVRGLLARRTARTENPQGPRS